MCSVYPARGGGETHGQTMKVSEARRQHKTGGTSREPQQRRYSQLVEVGAVGEEVVWEVLQLVVVQTPATKRW